MRGWKENSSGGRRVGHEGVRERGIALKLFPFVERHWPSVNSACLFPIGNSSIHMSFSEAVSCGRLHHVSMWDAATAAFVIQLC